MNMRDYEVPKEDRVVFAKVMAFLSAADGEVSLEEKQAIDDIIFAWKLDQSAIEEIYAIMHGNANLNEILSQIKNNRTPYLLIMELVTLASLDGHYSESEKRAINKIATSLNVSEGRFRDIEQWVEDGLHWRSRGLELISAEGA